VQGWETPSLELGALELGVWSLEFGAWMGAEPAQGIEAPGLRLLHAALRKSKVLHCRA
jgi:hypothetical protein